MKDPNFSESHLQSAVNIAIVRLVHSALGVWLLPVVPSLFAEFDLGWDSGFFIEGSNPHPDSAQEGCNVFLQYKLSGLLVGSTAREWRDWGQEYFRFRIPYTKRNGANQFVDDLHQWNCLKALADQGYLVYYVTNALLERAELQTHFIGGTLLDHTPALDVRNVSHGHKHVTFTETSNHFCLHSEKESESKHNVASVISSCREKNGTSLAGANEKLLARLSAMEGVDDYWKRDIDRIRERANSIAEVQFRDVLMHWQLARFIRWHVGAHMLWVASSDAGSEQTSG